MPVPSFYTVTVCGVAGQSVTGVKSFICFVCCGGAHQTSGHPQLKLTCSNSTHQPERHGHAFSEDTWGSNSLSQIRGSLRRRAGFSWHEQTYCPEKLEALTKESPAVWPLSWHTSWAVLLARREETHAHTRTHEGRPESGVDTMESENTRSCLAFWRLWLELLQSVPTKHQLH